MPSSLWYSTGSVLHHNVLYKHLEVSMFFLDGDIKIDIAIRQYSNT